jgi:hypothetical protein
MTSDLPRYDLVKGAEGWDLKFEGRTVAKFATKGVAIHGGQLEIAVGGKGTVRIHTEIGGIEEERTYPRSKDPLKSSG